MRIYVHGCAYTENLPTLILLYKLIQGNKKKRVKNHSRSDGILNVVSPDECHATYFALHLRREENRFFFPLQFSASFVLFLQMRTTTTRPCTVYIE